MQNDYYSHESCKIHYRTILMAFVECSKSQKYDYIDARTTLIETVVSCRSFSRVTKSRSFESFDKLSTCYACMRLSFYSLEEILSFATKKSMTTSVK